MEEVGETSTATTEVEPAPEPEVTTEVDPEPERQSKVSEVSAEPEVAKESSVTEKPDDVTEKPDGAKVSFASEEGVSEEPGDRPHSEPETINLETSPTASAVQSDENLLNLGADSDAALNLGGDDTEEQQAPPKGFDDDDDEEHMKLQELDEDQQLQEFGEGGEGEDELLLQEIEGGEESKLQYGEGEGEEEEIKPRKETKPRKKTQPKKAEEAAKKKSEKQKRTSLDLIEGIRPSQQASETNLDQIRRSIEQGGPLSAENIFGQIRLELGPPVTMTPESSINEEEGEEEESEEYSILAELGLQLKKEPIDRDSYEDEYRKLKEEEKILRMKNGILNKRLTEYYLRRKITKVFTEISIEMFEELLNKYDSKMEDLFEIRLRTTREKEAVDNELLDMIHSRDEQMEELIKSFRDMQDREFEIGHGLISTKTGKIISDKVIERLLQRQQQKSEDIAKIRLAYIKRRDRVREIEQKIKSLETIGGTLHLMDFEQLKMENQNFTDKIEERDEDLMKLRDRYSKAMISLAHIREKVNIIEVEIEDMCEKKNIETENCSKVREELNDLKMQRDYNRAERQRLRNQTGILTYPDLLNDMEFRVKTKEILMEVFNDLKEKHEINRIKLINIRKNIIFTEQEQIKQMNALNNTEVRDSFDLEFSVI